MFIPNSERPVNCPYPEPDKSSSCSSSYLKTHFNIILPSTSVTTTLVFQVYIYMMNCADCVRAMRGGGTESEITGLLFCGPFIFIFDKNSHIYLYCSSYSCAHKLHQCRDIYYIWDEISPPPPPSWYQTVSRIVSHRVKIVPN